MLVLKHEIVLCLLHFTFLPVLVLIVFVIDENEKHVDQNAYDQEIEQGIENECECFGIVEHID